MTKEYGLLVSFKDLYPTIEEEHAFTLGVEFGMLFAEMNIPNIYDIEKTINIRNKEIVERTAKALNWTIEYDLQISDEWIHIRLYRNPVLLGSSMLRVVK